MTVYDDNFYATIREGIQSSAAALVPILIDLFPGTLSVIDVGCGEGWWSYQFVEHGVSALAVDGSVTDLMMKLTPPLADGARAEPIVRFMRADLEHEPLAKRVGARFDMAICLEVAEHLPPERADTFIDDLCALSDVVVFSAAIPGQGGTGHVHCRWQSWWGKKFNDRGYWTSGDLRLLIWNDDRIENWYRANTIVACHHDVPTPYALVGGAVLDLVHPVLWNSVRP